MANVLRGAQVQIALTEGVTLSDGFHEATVVVLTITDRGAMGTFKVADKVVDMQITRIHFDNETGIGPVVSVYGIEVQTNG